MAYKLMIENGLQADDGSWFTSWSWNLDYKLMIEYGLQPVEGALFV